MTNFLEQIPTIIFSYIGGGSTTVIKKLEKEYFIQKYFYQSINHFSLQLEFFHYLWGTLEL